MSEGTGENIFIVRKGRLKTTPLTSILEGITRNAVIELAREQGLVVLEERFTRDEMYIADEVFVTGTAAELTPVREIDKRSMAPASPVRSRLRCRSAFSRSCGGKILRTTPGSPASEGRSTNVVSCVLARSNPQRTLNPVRFGLSLAAAV